MTPPDTPQLRRRVLWNLLTSPVTLLPVAVGGTLVAAGAVALSPLAAFGGIVTLAAAGGLTATRWLIGADGMTEKAYRELNDEAREEAERELDALERVLRRDRDPRTEAHLRRLRELHALLVDEPNVPIDVRGRAEELVAHSVAALRRTLEMLQRARSLRTVEAHRRLLADREQVIDEVEGNVDALVKALDDVRLLRSRDDDAAALAEVRGELERSLDVARRVDERVRQIEGREDYSDVVQVRE